MRKNGNEMSPHDLIERIFMGQEVSFDGKTWAVCAIDKNLPNGKPIGLTQPGFRKNDYPAEPIWVSPDQIKTKK
jgi:hypothetical protein